MRNVGFAWISKFAGGTITFTVIGIEWERDPLVPVTITEKVPGWGVSPTSVATKVEFVEEFAFRITTFGSKLNPMEIGD